MGYKNYSLILFIFKYASKQNRFIPNKLFKIVYSFSSKVIGTLVLIIIQKFKTDYP